MMMMMMMMMMMIITIIMTIMTHTNSYINNTNANNGRGIFSVGVNGRAAVDKGMMGV